MGGLGVHFALPEEEVNKLRSLLDEEERLDFMEVIEEKYFNDYPNFKAESDKAWDAMHRVLADGELTWDGGDYPLNHVVLAGELLYSQDDYIISLKSPSQVKDINEALQHLDEEEFRKRYYAIDPESYGFPLSEEDFGYTWEWFQSVRELYKIAAKEGRYVLFTADQ
jgi:hypothetical protein